MIVNFGGNVRFEPEGVIRPVDRTALIEALPEARSPIRAIGSLHSWSPLVSTTGTVVELDRLDTVEIIGGDPPVARVGAGAKLEHVMARLRESGYTLPAIGAVLEQTLAGAISTGTHGSGKRPICSYVRAVELARIDEKGSCEIVRIDSGDDLLAARCALGALGVLVSLEIEIVPAYWVEESIAERTRLRDILDETPAWPLQEFILVPWSWRWFSFRRRIASEPSSSLKRKARNLWNVAAIDVGGHILTKLATRIQKAGSDAAVRSMLQHVVGSVMMPGRSTTGTVEEILTLNHHWFRHLETEIFIPERRLEEAVRVIEYVVRVFGGDEVSASPDVTAILEQQAQRADLEGYAGSYTHHYPIFFRRVEPDDTLISMSHGNQVWYSISFFSYLEPRAPFYEMCALLGNLLADVCEARFHWGKYIPVSPERVIRSQPGLDRFREIADEYDPGLRFRNTTLRRYLGPEETDE